MPRPTIPVYTGEVPNRNQNQDQFSSNADSWLAYQEPLASDYNALAEFLNKYNYADGGFFTPKSGQQYPTITEFDLNVYYQVVFPNSTDTYTYTSGNLNGVTVQNGTVLRFDNETSTWEYQQPFAGGVSQGSFDSLTADFNSLSTVLNSKNVLINTCFDADTVVNQGDFTGDWSTLSVGGYGYDMWFKHSTTQIAQIVEEGTYKKGVIHTMMIDGVVAGKITSPMSGNWEIVVPVGSNYLDLYAGDFSRSWQPESGLLQACERYLFVIGRNGFVLFGTPINSTQNRCSLIFPARMAKVPNVTGTATLQGGSALGVDTQGLTMEGVTLFPVGDINPNGVVMYSNIAADARLGPESASQTDIIN